MGIFDFFKRDWHHSDPEKRTKAIRELDEIHQDVFEEKASKDPDKNVRLEALKKLNSVDILRQMASNDPEESVRKAAAARLNEEIARTLKKFSGEPTAKEIALAEEIASTSFAEETYRGITVPKLRLALVSKVTKQNVLLTAALRDLNEEVAAKALEGLKENALQDVANNSRHTSIRQAASAKLKAIRDAENTAVSKEEILKQQRAALLAQADRLNNTHPLVEQQKAFAELMSEAEKLGMGDQKAALDAIYASFSEQVKVLVAKQEAEELAARRAAEKAALEEKLLKEIEEFLNAPKADETKEMLEKAIDAAKAEAPNADPKWNARLQSLVFRKEKMYKAEVAAPKVVEELPEGAPSREEILAKLTALAENEIDAFTEKALRPLVRSWETLPLLEGEDPVLQSYNALRSKLSEKLNAWKEVAEKEFAEKSAELRKLIDAVKAIDENQEFREISMQLKEIAQKWKEIVGEDKFKYQELWKEFNDARSRFQEMRQWESWHNEEARDAILAELEALSKESASEELLDKTKKAIAKWKDVGPVSPLRLQEYKDKYKAFIDKIFETCAPILEAKNEERQENLKKKIELCEKAEALVADTETPDKDKYKAIKQLQEDWKNGGQIPRENLQELWDRFKAAIDAFFEQHKVALKEEDTRRQGNYEKKVELCEKAEALQESEDWGATTAAIKKLQEEWKTSGPVPKTVSEDIWNRFRTACDKFFERRRAHFDSLDAEKQANLEKKNAVCAKLEALTAEQADEATLNAIAEEWKQIGMVPKDDLDALMQRYMKATNEVIGKRAAVDSALAERLEAVRARKQEIIDRVNELADSAGVAAIAESVREFQNEWRTLGSCGTSEGELYKAFHDACDEFFARRRDQMEIQEEARKNNLQKKELLCAQAEKLLAAEDETPYNLVSQVKQLRRNWKEIGPVPREHSDKIWKRFNSACDAVFAKAHPEGNNKEEGKENDA